MYYVNHKKVEFNSIFRCCFYYYIFHKTIFTYIKMSKGLSVNYYQDNKKGYRKRLVKDIKVLLKKKKTQKYVRERYKKILSL